MRILGFIVTTCTLATSLAAQGRGRNIDGVPPGHRPPPGLCRVWITGVPPGHQPGVTDCATALATVPADGRVIFGDPSTAGRYAVGRSAYRAVGVRVGSIFTRRVYSNNGVLMFQRVRRNANGTYTVLSSTPIGQSLRVDGDDDHRSDGAGRHVKHGRGQRHGEGHGKKK